MNFYIDFEATQFTEEIISIGCIAENGNTFNCLVVPSNLKKITPFITDLTGITQEMVQEDGYSPECAFAHLKMFVTENNGDEMPAFYCYGNQDKTFLKNTIKHMHNLEMILFASAVRDMLVDYSVTVKDYLSNCGLSLKKLVALIRQVDEVEQNHDALDDAKMLKECFEGLTTLEKPTPAIRKVPTNQCNPSFQQAQQQLINEQGLLTPIKLTGRTYSKEEKDYIQNLRLNIWGQIPHNMVPGDAKEDNYIVKLTHIKTGNVKYFSDLHVAAMFFNGYILSSRSPKQDKALNSTMKEFARNPNNFAGYRCEIKMPIETNEKGE
jgi:inhibitor of KinA sporulation pathway (predicted exonuclease)